MANLPEVSQWEPGIYQLETTDPVVGGAPNVSTGAGKSNIPPYLLGNRTRFLKDLVEGAGLGVTAIPGAVITDFDAVTIGGRYRANAGAAHAPLAGVPFTLDHRVGAAANEAKQVAETLASARTFVRMKSAGAWGAWKEQWVGGSSQLTAAGWKLFPDGYLHNWGTGTCDASGRLLVSFGLSFSAANNYTVQAIHAGLSPVSLIEDATSPRTASQLTLRIFDNAGATAAGRAIRWLAYGW